MLHAPNRLDFAYGQFDIVRSIARLLHHRKHGKDIHTIKIEIETHYYTQNANVVLSRCRQNA